MKSVFSSLVLSSLLALSTSAQAKTASLDALNQFVDNLHSYSADFSQIQPDETLYQDNRSNGRFALKRPGKLVWVYQNPEPQEIVADGTNVWIYEEDIDQVSVHSLDSIQSDLPMSWLLYEEPISKRFDVIPGEVRDGVSWYNLVPKEGTFFQSIELALADGKMVQIWMYQSEDNVVKVAFENIRMNQAVNEKQFEFHAPKGVDVVGQAAR